MLGLVEQVKTKTKTKRPNIQGLATHCLAYMCTTKFYCTKHTVTNNTVTSIILSESLLFNIRNLIKRT